MRETGLELFRPGWRIDMAAAGSPARNDAYRAASAEKGPMFMGPKGMVRR
jgi:hypothetical protein